MSGNHRRVHIAWHIPHIARQTEKPSAASVAACSRKETGGISQKKPPHMRGFSSGSGGHSDLPPDRSAENENQLVLVADEVEVVVEVLSSSLVAAAIAIPTAAATATPPAIAVADRPPTAPWPAEAPAGAPEPVFCICDWALARPGAAIRADARMTAVRLFEMLIFTEPPRSCSNPRNADAIILITCLRNSISLHTRQPMPSVQSVSAPVIPCHPISPGLSCAHSL